MAYRLVETCNTCGGDGIVTRSIGSVAGTYPCWQCTGNGKLSKGIIELPELDEQIATMYGDIVTIKSDAALLKTRVEVVETAITALSEEVADIKDKCNDIKEKCDDIMQYLQEHVP